MTDLAALAGLLACPRCRGDVTTTKDAVRCAACAASFPVLDKLAWLVPDPAAAVRNWKALAATETDRLAVQAETVKRATKAPDLSPVAQRRLQKLLQGTIEQIKALAKLLEPLSVKTRGEDETVDPLRRAMLAKLPATQSLTAYYTNIHRDWGWEGQDPDENAAGLAAVRGVLPEGFKPQKILVLGAGAARLSYDLHQALAPELTLATDLNPLMLYAASRIVQGRTVTLYEFPVAPVDADSVALPRKHRAPADPLPGFELLFADAMNPPFKDDSFDLVLTPWLVDIVPQDAKSFFPKINRLVKPGGLWVNFGSIAFRGAGPERHYSKEEALELVRRAGFAVERESFTQIPYLQSPASCGGRVERVLSFAARKVETAPATPAFRYLPDWLTDVDQPIPALPAFQQFAMAHAYYAQTVGTIDGARSARQIAGLLAERFGMPADDALETFVRFLTTVYEEDIIKS